MASAFDKFGTAVPETENTGFNMTFTDEDLEGGERRSLYREVPEGEYDFTVYDLEFKQSKKGDDYVYITLSIMAPDGGEARVSDNLMCTKAAKWKLATFFKSIGMWEEVKKTGTNMAVWQSTVDKKMKGRIFVFHDEWNGKVCNRVRAYIAPGVSAVR